MTAAAKIIMLGLVALAALAGGVYLLTLPADHSLAAFGCGLVAWEALAKMPTRACPCVERHESEDEDDPEDEDDEPYPGLYVRREDRP